MDRDVRCAALIQPGRIQDVAAVLGLVVGIRKQNVGQLVAGILEHVADVALALIVEESVGCRVNIAEVLGTEGLDDVTRLIVQLTEVIRVGLNLHAQTLALDDRQKLLHRTEEHAVADLLLIRIARELGVDDRYAHVNGNLDDSLPVCNRVLSLFLGRTAPAVDDDERRDLHAGLLECLTVLLLRFLREQRMLIERVDARMRRLLDVLVAPVSDLVHHVVDAHLLGQYVYVKCDFHVFFSFPF